MTCALFQLPPSLVSPTAMVAASTLSRLEAGSFHFRSYLLNAMTLIAFVGMA